MREAVGIVLIIGTLGFGSLAAEQKGAARSAQTRLKVSGMHCGQCAKTVEKAARKVEGVIAAKASQPSASAEITYDSEKTDPDAIAEAISTKTPFRAEVVRK